MPHKLTHYFYYEETEGPYRDGEHRYKQSIVPTITGEVEMGTLLSMADDVIQWGQMRWQSDHGSYADHLAFINFVNAAIGTLQIRGHQ
jgi:hypothetical protein